MLWNVYSFKTSWWPVCYGAFSKIIKNYPALQFEMLFAERGNGIIGKYAENECYWDIEDWIFVRTPEERKCNRRCEREEFLPQYKEWIRQVKHITYMFLTLCLVTESQHAVGLV